MPLAVSEPPAGQTSGAEPSGVFRCRVSDFRLSTPLTRATSSEGGKMVKWDENQEESKLEILREQLGFLRETANAQAIDGYLAFQQGNGIGCFSPRV